MASERYNGWTNYETWCVHLWQTNDQVSDMAIRAIVAGAHQVKPTSYLTDGFAAQRLKEYIEALMQYSLTKKASMWHDLAIAALSEVNWQEIAENLAESVEPGRIRESEATP